MKKIREKADSYFTCWNYKKHAKFCTAVYLGMYAFDMTVSYIICKKILDHADAKKEAQLK